MGSIIMSPDINYDIIDAIEDADIDDLVKDFIYKALELEYDERDKQKPQMMPKYRNLFKDIEKELKW